MNHTVEKIGGTSMSEYEAVRDNVILKGNNSTDIFNRVFVVSAYGGMTDLLLENKKNGNPGVYAMFANTDSDDEWQKAFAKLRTEMYAMNNALFGATELGGKADTFISKRLDDAERVLVDLERLCQHGHFELEAHLFTVREMLASLGEAHSAWNMAHLLQRDGINARFIDLSGWQADGAESLDNMIKQSFADADYDNELLIATGYTHCDKGLMASFDRGYSEMTFSRIAVLTEAREAIIHKEYHLSSADPRLVGAEKVVPIGRTNYDVADQLANLGMEAIHPRAAKGLRQADIPLRVMNTFEPDHAGTLITGDYVSETPRVEIIAGRKRVYAIELFDQDMMGNIEAYDSAILKAITRFKAHVVSKDLNANTITHYVGANLKTVNRIRRVLEETYPDAEINTRKVAVISAIGSDMKVPGMLAKTVSALSEVDISILAMHQSIRQVDMQFVIGEDDYDKAVQSLHRCLIEVHNHGDAICAA
ncbi:aspartate kinase [Gilvimarinus agarilyticus]|uniref:aspartate kinase n=1 Tax=unclassified Gilvimarinus TaxID=2642066 RepID=UPI001C0A13AC|nr:MULTISPECIES: aspartate kinase [unclassified Gilvimarinus]MBU2885178.1 aspartate kinase [Gilvimarinus agarilyticus]MDO6570077.1 aspartate kinase [Gilvimarinus sp. 2_MG-2023]MDO6745628.1 aspartate kinase [Gilvimarinus sp. 1_MG-2023]